MVQKKKSKLEKPLTEVELELMNVIWDMGEGAECGVRDVQAALPKSRDLAYTTVATMMKILEQKGALASRMGERSLAYTPRISRAAYGAVSLQHLAEHVFKGDPSSMVVRLLSDSDLSQDELKAIRNLLNERLTLK